MTPAILYLPSLHLADDLTWSEPALAQPDNVERSARLAILRARTISRSLTDKHSDLDNKIARAWETLTMADKAQFGRSSDEAETPMDTAFLRAQLALSTAVMLERRERTASMEAASDALITQMESTMDAR